MSFERQGAVSIRDELGNGLIEPHLPASFSRTTGSIHQPRAEPPGASYDLIGPFSRHYSGAVKVELAELPAAFSSSAPLVRRWMS
jgi:hypothetical protein